MQSDLLCINCSLFADAHVRGRGNIRMKKKKNWKNT